MSKLVKMNDSEASYDQSKKMEERRNIAQRTVGVYGRQPDQYPLHHRESGQRLAFQPGTPPISTVTTPTYNANQSVGTTKKKIVHYFLSKSDESELNTCKNAWVPLCLRKNVTNDCQSSGDNDKQIEETRKKLLSILNKISPENMTQLTGSINSLTIDTEEQIKNVIEVLFQKAINEPSFTPLYAFVCKSLNQKDIKSKDEMQKLSFKNVLTKCCQDRFGIMQVHENKLAKSLKDLNDCNDQDIKEKLQLEYDQEERVHRKRSVGNCRFMCELYKVQIISNRTLEMCMKHLLKSPNEETLECVCNILTHAGKTLNHKVIFERLNDYTSSAYKKSIPTRIRFMILDTIDLKEHDWVPRNSRIKPEFRNKKVHSHAGRSEIKQSPRAQNITAVFPTKKVQKPTDLIKCKPPTEIKKDDEHKNSILEKCTKSTDAHNCLSSPAISMCDVVKGETSSVLPCVIPTETNNTNSGQTLNDENTEIQEIQEKCQSILDKITTENMVSSANSIISMPIKTVECLKNIVDLVFQKAVDEPLSIPQYAHVCSEMKNVEIRSTNQETGTSFIKLLVSMCQDAFESINTRRRLVAKTRNDIESCKDKEIRKKLQLQFDENELAHRKRSVANCRFMCELLKVNILVPPILEMCLAKLIQCPKELSLECVCIILQHAGSAIDHCGIFEKLLEYSTAQKPAFSPRIRSMILNTLELKDNDSVKRKTGDKPSVLVETKEETFADLSIRSITTLPSTDQLQPVLKDRNSLDPELNDYTTVESIIASVSADNMNTAINELSVHIKNIDVMKRTIDLIFARAKNHPKTIPELVGVCSSLRNKTASSAVEEHVIKPSSLKQLIAIRCNKVLISGIQNDPSENESTSKDTYAFIGELFNKNVISVHILLEFLKIIPEKLSNGTLENICSLLKVAGKKIEQAYSLRKTVIKLTDMVSNDVERIFSRRCGVLLKTLVELRDKKWVA